MVEHCGNVVADRKLGDYWERAFCYLAAVHGMSFTPMQIGRSTSAQAGYILAGRWHLSTLPDVTIWTCPGQHHEIKHKNPTRFGCFGLEAYRFDALMWFAEETEQDVMYTIHNHDLSGGRDPRRNEIDHWFTVNIRDLDGQQQTARRGFSYIAGEAQETRVFYWSADLWLPLREYWRVPIPSEADTWSRPF